MIIDCISDLHGYHPELQGGDLLIIAGDLTARDTADQHMDFMEWLGYMQNYGTKYKKVIYIAGNHDAFLDKSIGSYGPLNTPASWNIIYLCDTGIEFEGLKIWGSPWTPTFFDWHFMKDRGEDIKKMWDLIPDDTDILITHGPAYGIQDEVKFSSKGNGGKYAGCEELKNTLPRLKNLKLHVFGHVHEGYGQSTVNGVIHVNASIMDHEYKPVNKPIRIEL
jgi:Icc-related predicted phosphoesterase